jgi:adenosylcobinamide kinase/adenosylcobinamide-phosphate guanylyltransferase
MKIFITGGIGSGKSSFALKKAKEISEEHKISKKIFVATAEPFDEEMKLKIQNHKKEREGLGWETREEPINIWNAFEGEKNFLAIVDCVTTWLGNIFFYFWKDTNKLNEILERFKRFVLSQNFGVIIFISNECGQGVIPQDEFARLWLRKLSEINKFLAQISDEVYFMVSGIPMKLK